MSDAMVGKDDAELAGLLDRGLALQRAGRAAEALDLYRGILAVHPRQFDALHFLAILEFRSGRSDVALARMREAIEVNPRSALAHYNYGNLLQAVGRPVEALASYDRALELRPGYAEALANRGDVLQRLNRLEESVKSYDRALELQPQFPEALVSRGNALRGQQRFDEALASYDRALALCPDYYRALLKRANVLRILRRLEEALVCYDRALELKPDLPWACYDRGTLLEELQRHGEALASFERALALRPEFAEAVNGLGVTLLAVQLPEEALARFERALALRPDYPEALVNRGNALNLLRRPEQALADFDAALTLRPDDVVALNNRANVLRILQRPAEALLACERALKLRPDFVEALNNRGNILEALYRPEEALQSYGRALALRPDYAEIHWNAGVCRLRIGDFERGWAEHEWRRKVARFAPDYPVFPQQQWLQEKSRAGETVLLYAEQGLGDTIQFCRYAELLARLGLHVILEVQPQLKSLLSRLEGSAVVVGKGEPLPNFDFYSPLMSLPFAFATTLTTIPDRSPYIFADPHKIELWRQRLGDRGGMRRLGIAWSGFGGHANDVNRSMSLQLLVKAIISKVPAEFVSLQKEVRPADREVLARDRDIRHFEDLLEDFSDTAALIHEMDLVISVDTSVAHLAGAMGKPVWVLLPHLPDWRWLLEREDSPWYPTARLFRQPSMGDWESVLSKVVGALCRTVRD